MKKALRITRNILLTLLGLLLALWLLLQMPFFQRWLAQNAAARLSKSLGTTVSVKNAYIGWLNRVNLEGVFMADQKKDTLISIGRLQVNTSDWLLFRDTARLKYLSLKDVVIKMNRVDTIWNYDFLSGSSSEADTTTQPPAKKDTSAKKGLIGLPSVLQLEVVEVENLRLIQEDKWRGRGLEACIQHMLLKARDVNIKKNIIDIESLDLVRPEYKEFRRAGLWSAADSIKYYRRIDSLDRLRTFPESWNPDGLKMSISKLALKDGFIELYNRPTEPSTPGIFDPSDIIITPINGTLSHVLLNHDTLTAKADINTRERSGLHVKSLKADFKLHPQLMEFSNMNLQLNESTIGPYYAMRYRTIDDMEYYIDSVMMISKLENSIVSMQDIAFFTSSLKSIKQTAVVSGSAAGTVSNFMVNNLDLITGKSRLTGSYAMRGLIDIDKTIIKFQTPGSQIALSDVAVWAPQVKDLEKGPLANLGVVGYKGTFEGTVYDFLTQGTVSSSIGTADASFKLRMDGAKKGFEAVLKNANIDGGRLLGIEDIGNMKLDATVTTNGFSEKSPYYIKGKIKSFQYHGYEYKDIVTDAVFVGEKMSANLASSDPNLGANFTTELDFSKRKQSYNARGSVAYADLLALKLADDSIRVSGLFDVNFSGENIDDFRGYARVYDAEVYSRKQLLNIDSLYINSSIDSNGIEKLLVQTNEADIMVTGNFNISDLPSGFQQFLRGYYPSFIPAPKHVTSNQQLTFSVETRNVEPFLPFIDPKLKGLNYTSLLGSLDTRKNELLVNLDMPFFEYDGIRMNNTSIRANGSTHALALTGSIENLKVNDSIGFPNAQLVINTVNDTTQVKINTSTNGPLGEAEVSGFVYSKPDGFEAKFDESSFILNNKKWTLSSDGSVQMKRGYLIANGIQLSNDNQRINLYTQPSDDGYWNDVYVDVSNLIMGDLLPFFLTDPRIEGVLDANMVVQDPMGKPVLESNFKAKNFHLNIDSIGLVEGNIKYDAYTGKLYSTIDSRNPGYDFSANLKLDLDSTAHNQLDLVLELRKERIKLLEKYLEGIFDEMDGYATGQLKLYGKMKTPSLTGDVLLTGGKLKVDYTQCTYLLDDARLKFGDNFIDFGTIGVADLKGRRGTMEGIMYHRFFDSLSFDMSMRTNSMQLLDTKSKDNDLFYGDAVGKASFELYGPLKNLHIDIVGSTTDTSHIIIANKSSKESGTADFIVFKQYGVELGQMGDTSATNMHVNLDLTATPLCEISVIMDEITGDIIKANGSGNLKIKNSTAEPTEMRGKYQINSGSYNFSFQTLIKKPFELEGGENNFIEWTGDPYDANLNVSAKYTAHNVSLRDLMTSEQGRTVLDQNAQSYKGDVYVKTKLTGLLSKPDIDFAIEFPHGSPMQNNVSAQQMLRQIEADKNEMFRQVTYLIVFKRFAPYKEGTGAGNPGTDLAVNTISDLLSSQMGKILTNVIQDITGDRSLNIDFSTEVYNSASTVGGSVNTTTSGYDRVNFNFMINKSYFNNRVVVNLGSEFDMNVKNTTTTGFQFLPDVSVEFILTNNRRLRAIIFKKDALDYSGRRNRGGVSLSFRKDYDKFISSNKEEALIFIRKDAKE
ncbi:MAG TPA: translocation/assembly module TamB domain-containing protein [Phnomibacter sp.]|nr:translocation/assembly module TamB domain-containing protein [Phnomibacter sp.]